MTDAPATNELLACPFCGCEGTSNKATWAAAEAFEVECSSCGASVPPEPTEELASSHWNTRYIDDDQPPYSEREAIALEIWHRFAENDTIEWADETHKDEYLMCADSIIALRAAATPSAQGAESALAQLGSADAKERIAALAHRLWSIHPREIQDMGLTREQFYVREITALFDLLPDASPGNGAEKVREALGWLLDAVIQEVKFSDSTPLLKRRVEDARAALHSTSAAGETTSSDGGVEGHAFGRPIRSESEQGSRCCAEAISRSAIPAGRPLNADEPRAEKSECSPNEIMLVSASKHRAHSEGIEALPDDVGAGIKPGPSEAIPADVLADLNDAREEAADSLRTLDAIAEYVGCPHDEELTVDHVRQHYMKLENAAQRQGIEDAGRIANERAHVLAMKEAWPEPQVTNPDIADPTGIPYIDCLLHRLLDAQQDINFHSNETMSQSVADAAALIDEVETAIRKLAAIDKLSPEVKAESGRGEPVAIKPLEWRDHRPDSFPEPAWSAQTPFGYYNIEEVSASDSPAYVVRLHAHHFIADKDSLEDAKGAAQADYEQRIRSALVVHPASPADMGAIRADEREKCARIAEAMPQLLPMSPKHVRGLRGSDVASAIRTGGQK